MVVQNRTQYLNVSTPVDTFFIRWSISSGLTQATAEHAARNQQSPNSPWTTSSALMPLRTSSRASSASSSSFTLIETEAAGLLDAPAAGRLREEGLPSVPAG
eukprot:Amastigsp_a842664_10.p6 type:complete len:102 gc:universal Amastigsp_a842664_10:1162-1467(+)